MVRRYRIAVLEGDGIGPEVVGAALDVLGATAAAEPELAYDLVPLPMGAIAIAAHGTPLPRETVQGLRTCDGWISGPHDNQSYPVGAQGTPNTTLRRELDLFANVRPSRALNPSAATAPDIDLVIVRENTEGFYSDRNLHRGHGELMPTADVALTVGVFTRPAIRRIVDLAFRLAAQRRKRLTVVHKANVLRDTTGMYLEVAEELAPGYPEVAWDDVLVDAAAALLVRTPARFDVLVTENLFGDVLSDLAAELAGSLGAGSSLNAGERQAMAQASHGAAPDIAGRGIANPVGLVLSTALLLRWLGEATAPPCSSVRRSGSRTR